MKYGFYTVEIEGLELDFRIEDEEYDAGDTLGLKISNTGGTDADSNVSVTFDGIDLGSQQASIAKGEVSTLYFALPGSLNSGTYVLKVKCEEENTDRTLDYSKTIYVKGLDYKPSVDTFSAGRGEAINVSVNNTGIVPLSGSYDLVLSNETGEMASTNGTVSVLAGGLGVFSLTVPTSVLSGDYQIIFSIEDQNGEEESVSAFVYVPDPSLVLNLNSREFLQGETIEATVSGLYSSDWNFTLSLQDRNNNAVNSTVVFKPAGEITDGSVLLELIVPDRIFTGTYVFRVEADGSATESSTAADVRIEGITLTPEIRTDSQEYLENDTIRYTAVLTASAASHFTSHNAHIVTS